MSVWIELRCEARTQDFAGGGWENHVKVNCWSFDNEGLGRLSFETKADVAYVYSLIKKDAQRHGWKLVKRIGWVCPYCLNHIEKFKED